MELGFSWAGAIFLAMLFIPNIVWCRNTPLGYEQLTRSGNRALLACERVGQAAATVTALVFVSPHGYQTPWILWAIAALISMVLYELAWARYFYAGELPDCTSRSARYQFPWPPFPS